MGLGICAGCGRINPTFRRIVHAEAVGAACQRVPARELEQVQGVPAAQTAHTA